MAKNPVKNEKGLVETLERIVKVLNELKIGLEAVNKKIDHSEIGLPGINDKLDSLTSYMFHVQNLANGTYELLTHYVGKHKKEISQIKKKTGIVTDYD